MEADRVVLIERGNEVGESFKNWPKEMRFVSPSFNSQGWTNSFDLNSIAYGTSTAFTVCSEHPTGKQYADYLRHVANANNLFIRKATEVTSIRPLEEGFEVDIAPSFGIPNGHIATYKTLRCRYVVWCGGEFQYPGGEFQHSTDFEGSVAKNMFQWGRYEKVEEGVDASDEGVKATSTSSGGGGTTAVVHRMTYLKARKKRTPPPLTDDLTIAKKSRLEKHDDDAKGMKPSRCDGISPLLNDVDESTKTPGLYLCGPSVRHKDLSFCFVYKFRQRFGVVADSIARGLGYYTKDSVAECRVMNMFLDDFECCQAACGESC